MVSYPRTDAHRAASRARALASKPWEHSTGPRTPDGKAASARNPYRGAMRSRLRTVARVLREQRRCVEELRT